MAKGQLSTSEKLASKNPAQRRAGQREAAAMSSSKRSKTVSKAKNISKRGYSGTVSIGSQGTYRNTNSIS